MQKSKSLKTWIVVKSICVLSFVTFMPYNAFAAPSYLQADTSKITFNLSQNLEATGNNHIDQQNVVAQKRKKKNCTTYCCLYRIC